MSDGFRLLKCRWRRVLCSGIVMAGFLLPVAQSLASTNVYLVEVPDYEWRIGCFGTAGGNLMGYWDRHGFPNFYTGPTGGGVAPLNSYGQNAGIQSLWASQAGLDGRPSDQPGHVDDYYISYLSTADDPFVTKGRSEHKPDCIGDFIGLDQKKWKNMDGECDGNLDGYSFCYWDHNGDKRVNFTPGPEAGLPAIDIQSGLRAWTEYRERAADTLTQLVEFNPEVPAGKGFTFHDLKAEIDAGYPVLLFLQDTRAKSRAFDGLQNLNPLIHGTLAYGYYITDDGRQFVRYRTSFASGDSVMGKWEIETVWAGIAPLRGVIAYHPRPQITKATEEGAEVNLEWDGPSSELFDVVSGTSTKLNWYVVERATSLESGDFEEVTEPTTERHATVPKDLKRSFFRVKLLSASDLPP